MNPARLILRAATSVPFRGSFRPILGGGKNCIKPVAFFSSSAQGSPIETSSGADSAAHISADTRSADEIEYEKEIEFILNSYTEKYVLRVSSQSISYIAI